MTWDHVPPKGGIELLPVEIDRIASELMPGVQAQKPEISHDGLKFRTLCADCNSLLGQRYDPALNEFAIAVGRFLRTSLHLPELLHLEIRPTAVARAVLGHLLAARLSTVEAFFDPDIRTIVFDPDMTIPEDLSVFYWVHPYAQQIVFRDALMPKKRGGFSDFQRIGTLKYFPLGFLVTDASQYESLDALTHWRKEPSSTTIKIPIRIKEVRDAFWPEAPTPGNFLCFGQEGMESVRAHPKPELFEGIRPST
ncbi:MAG: hypothetical protein ISS63_04975 [Desulfobacteraceae bacterium]|nr:hypothetical protein [Desulfobacteraceae bacterium]